MRGKELYMMDTEHYTDNPETVTTSENLYEQAAEQNLHTHIGERRTREACLKIAARQNQEILSNINDLEYYNRHGLEKGVRKIARKLDEYPPLYKPVAYLKPFRESEEIPEEVITKAKQLLNQSEDAQKLIGKSNTSRAAAAVYAAGVLTENYMTYTEVVEIGDVSEPTLRTAFKITVEELGLIDDILDRHPYPTRTRWSGGEN